MAEAWDCLVKVVTVQAARPKAHLQAIREFLEQRVQVVVVEHTAVLAGAEKINPSVLVVWAQSVLSGPAQLAHSHQLVRGIYK
jgi:hypothetical protein